MKINGTLKLFKTNCNFLNTDSTVQYNIVLLQSQTDRCEGDIYTYNSITNRQLPRRTVLWDSTVTSDYR